MLVLQACEENEDTCPTLYLHGYESVTSADGSSTTTEAIMKCYPPST